MKEAGTYLDGAKEVRPTVTPACFWRGSRVFVRTCIPAGRLRKGDPGHYTNDWRSPRFGFLDGTLEKIRLRYAKAN